MEPLGPPVPGALQTLRGGGHRGQATQDAVARVVPKQLVRRLPQGVLDGHPVDGALEVLPQHGLFVQDVQILRVPAGLPPLHHRGEEDVLGEGPVDGHAHEGSAGHLGAHGVAVREGRVLQVDLEHHVVGGEAVGGPSRPQFLVHQGGGDEGGLLEEVLEEEGHMLRKGVPGLVAAGPHLEVGQVVDGGGEAEAEPHLGVHHVRPGGRPPQGDPQQARCQDDEDARAKRSKRVHGDPPGNCGAPQDAQGVSLSFW